MKLRAEPELHTLSAGDTKVQFLETGDIFLIQHKGLMLNGLCGNCRDGAANQLWLRRHDSEGIRSAPLLGAVSDARWSIGKTSVLYEGEALGAAYTVRFVLCAPCVWLWQVTIAGEGNYDMIYGQDIGAADRGGVLTNELYMAQYLGHSAFEASSGYIIRSRQNQRQSTGFPVLTQGSLGVKTTSYATDGLDFFGLSHKADRTPVGLQGDLPGRINQQEFSYVALQTQHFRGTEEQRFTFYAWLSENEEEGITGPGDLPAPIGQLAFPFEEPRRAMPRVLRSMEFGAPYASQALDEKEIAQMYPARELTEHGPDGALWSFFLKDSTHVVTAGKELACQRPHGGILQTCTRLTRVDNGLLGSTHYMYGVFGSQTVIGNTSFHKLHAQARGLLNIMTNSGQRLYVRIKEKYRLLTVPALYETGLSHASWHYVIGDDLVTVTLFASAHEPAMTLTVHSRKGIAYDYLLTQQLVAGEHEYIAPAEIRSLSRGRVKRVLLHSPYYPGAHFDLHLPSGAGLSGDGVFYEDGITRHQTLVSMRHQGDFSMTVTGSLADNPVRALAAPDLIKERRAAEVYMRRLTRGFSLAGLGDVGQVLTHTARWHAQCALTHYAMPHGLEQPGGAAWGTRDVCQGPFELFLTLGHFELCRAILKEVFSHQGQAEWPQWFMFDRFPYAAGDCHGDVVFWPLKSLCDYVEATGDTAVLDVAVPYAVDRPSEPLREHVRRAFEEIVSRFIGDTGLITYAGGDWDDTLQPAMERMKDHLVSAWTVALCYQTLAALARLPLDFADEARAFARRIERDFPKRLTKDGVIAGFLLQNEDGQDEYLLHPRDKTTGITLRLLPMTRAIIAGLSSLEQAVRSLDAIDRKLACPDGVRLMDAPARYLGGVSRMFQRAEQAANVGREISLQYVHAHIRYVEAMARLGRNDRTLSGLLTIAMPLLSARVPNAMPRQSNLYFSSSEGDYSDRYAYAADFDRLRKGTIGVKGGWRLYSSGPGIYIRQLLAHVLGVSLTRDGAVFDPVLPKVADGMMLSLTVHGTRRTIRFTVGKALAVTIGGAEVGQSSPAGYRPGGIRVTAQDLGNARAITVTYPIYQEG